MNEYTLQLIAFCKLLWIACFSYLYGLGGIRYKFLRRFVGPAWIALGIFGFQQWQSNVNYWSLTYPILLCFALVLGYGGDDFKQKLLKRAYVGLALGISALPLAIISRMWILFAYSLILTISASIVFGVWNPFKSARDEESNIATAAVWLPMFMV